MATQAKGVRKASDALKGAAVPEEETAAPTGDTATGQPLFEAEPATASKTSEENPEVQEVKGETPEVIPESDPEYDLFDVVVVIDQFNYFDDDGSHLSATKGDVLTLDAETASRGFTIGALRPQD